MAGRATREWPLFHPADAQLPDGNDPSAPAVRLLPQAGTNQYAAEGAKQTTGSVEKLEQHHGPRTGPCSSGRGQLCQRKDCLICGKEIPTAPASTSTT